MAVEQPTTEKVKIPLCDFERPLQVTGMGYGPVEQYFLNCFPIIAKNPTAPDSGEVFVRARPSWGNWNSAALAVVNWSTILGANWQGCVLKAALLMQGWDGNVVILVFHETDGVATSNLKVVEYRTNFTTSAGALLGTINVVPYGWIFNDDDRYWTVHLSQISHGTSPTTPYQGFALTLHPTRCNASTAANSDCFYAWSTNPASSAGWTAVTAIADVDFPTNTPAKGIVGAVVQMNNVHYIMTADGFIYGSYPSLTFPFQPDIVTWNSAGNTAAQQIPDGGRGLFRYKHHLIAFGEKSLEFFNDEGLAQPSLPIRRTQQAFTRIGTINSKSYCLVDDTLYWLGTGDSGNVGFYKMDGYTPICVSDMKQASALNTHYYPEDIRLQPMPMYGSKHIIMHYIQYSPQYWPVDSSYAEPVDGPVLNAQLWGSLVYCIDSDAFWVLTFEPIFGPMPQVYYVMSPQSPNGFVWTQHLGEINPPVKNYGLTPIFWNEYGSQHDWEQMDSFPVDYSTTIDRYPVFVMWNSNILDFGSTDRKTISRFRLTGEMQIWINPTMTGNPDGNKSIIWVNKDNESENFWQSPLLNPISEMYYVIDYESPSYSPTYNFNNLGTARKWQFNFASSAGVQLKLKSAEVNLRRNSH